MTDPKEALADDTCREAFEIWASKVNSDVARMLRRKPSGEYLLSGASLAWKAWRNAWCTRASLERPVAEQEACRAICEG